MQQTNLERLLRGLVDWLKRAWTEITQNLPGVKEGLPWIVLMITVWIYLTVATDVIWGRSHGEQMSVWESDYAIFHQAGYLWGHGYAGEVYQSFNAWSQDWEERLTTMPEVWGEYMENGGGFGTYSYGQMPWHALFMVPFGFLSIEQGYDYFSSVMLLLSLVAAGLVFKHTRPGWLWASLLLLLPIVAPFVSGSPWYHTRLQLQWYLLGIGEEASAVQVAFWLGQPIALLLVLIVGGLIAAARDRMWWAGLLLVLAMMKPSVVIVAPLFLLVTPNWGKLIKCAAIWATVLNAAFSLVPGLGYPAAFFLVSSGHVERSFLHCLQAQNWVWIYGAIITVFALRYSRVRQAADEADDIPETVVAGEP